MTTQSLNARIAHLTDSNKSVVLLIHRLSKLNFQPGSTPLDDDTNDVRVELSAEIHDNLKQQEEELEILRQEFNDLASSIADRRKGSEKDRERSRIAVQLAKLGEDLRHSRAQFRSAQLTAKRNAEAAKAKERSLLFTNIQEGNNENTPSRRRGNQQLTKEELEVQASSDVTAALRRTHQLMQSELSRSQFAQETLDQSTAALAQLSEQYTSLGDLLSSSRNLLGVLLRSQKSDTWYLETAFYILLCTIIWLVYRRFFYGPLWWLVWLPLKSCYRLLSWTLSSVGLVGSSVTVNHTLTSTGSSLIIKPSAEKGPPSYNMADKPATVRTRAGGTGAKQDLDPSPEGSLSREVGQIAENSEGSQVAGEDKKTSKTPARGDGNELKESDAPRNQKKRMWEEPPPEKDEL
ncbi:Sec20-domain-containing protein [Patellaria atrata CBS 101060]|uniref:Sec20-domain-containing protein n=1 Tax=Patellaria atrata CBS 101060 TaxID=1346257 RepID=A0A9P4S494_9PEZI|nr:Sec20-domain-containing protein [Patellaria atrata CBS 101060]